ncbi:MAG TPA: SMI1/KNR4 family protein [Planctomicrobium sp.]|nr:SMI1/KNR4 family protein [Planctomicrobium sp.]
MVLSWRFWAKLSLARFLKTQTERLECLDAPATHDDITAFEQSIGIPLPATYRQFLLCTRQLKLEGLSLGFDDIWSHPALIPLETGTSAALCIADYWLEADGDQLLLEWTATPKDDPGIFYYAHEEGSNRARPLSMRLSQWLESLPKSPIFREK